MTLSAVIELACLVTSAEMAASPATQSSVTRPTLKLAAKWVFSAGAVAGSGRLEDDEDEELEDELDEELLDDEDEDTPPPPPPPEPPPPPPPPQAARRDDAAAVSSSERRDTFDRVSISSSH